MRSGRGQRAWEAQRRATIVTLIDAETFDDVTTSYNSAKQDVDEWRYFLLFLSVDSTNTPTTIQFLLQFSDDGGTTWYTYKQGLFAALFYEDQDTASGIYECFGGIVWGRDIRLRAVAVGTSETNTFVVTAKLELWS